MNCPNCKNPIEDNASICEWCGENIPNSYNINSNKNSEYCLNIQTEKIWTPFGSPKLKIIIDGNPISDMKLCGGENQTFSITEGSHNVKFTAKIGRVTELVINVKQDTTIFVTPNPTTGKLDAMISGSTFIMKKHKG
jgi:hypothetical protein